MPYGAGSVLVVKVVVKREDGLNMELFIQKIYETRKVVGQSGKVHRLRSAVDPQEGKFITDIIHNDPEIRKTIEVGCAHGLSTLNICFAIRERVDASHTIIDPYENTHWDGVGIRNLEENGIAFFDLIEAGSEFALPRLLEKEEGQFDFVFIDGWHTFDHALLDCFYATRLLRVGGYLVIDDAYYPSVGRVVAFLKNYPCYTEYATTEPTEKTWRAFLKRLAAMVPLQRKVWAKVINRSIYRKVFERRVSMIALKKIDEDNRKFSWHTDAF